MAFDDMAGWGEEKRRPAVNVGAEWNDHSALPFHQSKRRDRSSIGYIQECWGLCPGLVVAQPGSLSTPNPVPPAVQRRRHQESASKPRVSENWSCRVDIRLQASANEGAKQNTGASPARPEPLRHPRDGCMHRQKKEYLRRDLNPSLWRDQIVFRLKIQYTDAYTTQVLTGGFRKP